MDGVGALQPTEMLSHLMHMIMNPSQYLVDQQVQVALMGSRMVTKRGWIVVDLARLAKPAMCCLNRRMVTLIQKAVLEQCGQTAVLQVPTARRRIHGGPTVARGQEAAVFQNKIKPCSLLRPR
jgi:hypothetical protein